MSSRVAHVVRLGRHVGRRLIADQCFETAAALAYATLVSLVPLTVAALAIFSALPTFEPMREYALAFVFGNFVPAAGDAVQDAISGFASNAARLTGISAVAMVASVVTMLVGIEQRFNRIWRAPARRWGARVLLYVPALVVGPVLVGGVAVLASLVGATAASGVAGPLLAGLPFLLTFATLWLMQVGIPNRRVPRRPAALGALAGAVLFELARHGFALFVAHAHSYREIYGVLAAIPIFLLWIYLSWLIVMVSASFAAALAAFR